MLEDAGRGVFIGNHDIGKALIIAQQHIETWTQALDKIRFKQQRLGLGMGCDKLHIDRIKDHLGDAVGVPAHLGIRGNALL